MEVQVRPANKDDALAIAEMAMKLVEQHIDYDPRRFAKIATLDGMKWFYGSQTKAEEARVLVAEVEKRVVGFAYFAFEKTNYAALSVSSGWIHDIYVAEDARGSGAGQELIEAVKSEAKRMGATKLLLTVAAKNSLAQDFFEKQGFRTTMHEMMLVLD